MNKGEKIYLLGIIGMFAGGFALENAFLLGVSIFLISLIACTIVLVVNGKGFVDDEGEVRSLEYDDDTDVVWENRDKVFREWIANSNMKKSHDK